MQFDYLLQRELERRYTALREDLEKGLADDWGKYCKLSGEMCGIRFALEMITDVRRQLNEAGVEE